MTAKTKFLDLDAIETEKPEIVVKLKGVEHKLATFTVTDFIESQKAIQRAGMSGDFQEEFDLAVTMLMRSFPTMEEKDLRALTFDQLDAINKFARSANGADEVVAEAEKEADENPQTAGS